MKLFCVGKRARLSELMPHDGAWISQRKHEGPSWQEIKLQYEQYYLTDVNFGFSGLLQNTLLRIQCAMVDLLRREGVRRKPRVFISFAYPFGEESGYRFEGWTLESIKVFVTHLTWIGFDCYFSEGMFDELVPKLGKDIIKFMKDGVSKCDQLLFFGTETFWYKTTHHKGADVQDTYAVCTEYKAALKRSASTATKTPIIIPLVFSSTGEKTFPRLCNAKGMINALSFVRNDAQDATNHSYIGDSWRVFIELYRNYFKRRGIRFTQLSYLKSEYVNFGLEIRSSPRAGFIKRLKQGLSKEDIVEIEKYGGPDAYWASISQMNMLHLCNILQRQGIFASWDKALELREKDAIQEILYAKFHSKLKDAVKLFHEHLDGIRWELYYTQNRGQTIRAQFSLNQEGKLSDLDSFCRFGKRTLREPENTREYILGVADFDLEELRMYFSKQAKSLTYY